MEAEERTSPAPAPLTVIRRRRRVTVAGEPPADQRVAAVIPAKDESERIADTVRAARAIPHVDLVLVVDDGSEDDTGAKARAAGAVVVRHATNRGKASAMETGAAVVAMRDDEDGLPRMLLFLDADLGDSAVNAAPLVPPVWAGRADMSIAVLPKQAGAGGRGLVTGFARRSIHRFTGWSPAQPLSGQRCITRSAFDAALPLARGWGVETVMSIDVLLTGFAVVEVPCDLRHRPSGNDLAGQLHRAAQMRDVMAAVAARTLRRYPKLDDETDGSETGEGTPGKSGAPSADGSDATGDPRVEGPQEGAEVSEAEVSEAEDSGTKDSERS